METETTDLDGDWEAVEVEEATTEKPNPFEKYSERELVDTCVFLSDQLDDLSIKWEALNRDHISLVATHQAALTRRDELQSKLLAAERAFGEAQDEIRGLRHALTSQVNQVGMLTEVLHRVTEPE